MNPIVSIAKAIFGFGSSRQLETVDKTVDHIANGIDKFFYTDQEKAEAAKTGYDQFLKFMELNRDENSERSIARREIAKKWIAIYLNLVIGYLVVVAISIRFEALNILANAFKEAIVLLGTGTLMVLGFYFGVHLLRGLSFGSKGESK